MHTDRIVFDAVRTASWRDNRRLYRVHLLNGELLFLPVGTAGLGQHALHPEGGIVEIIGTTIFNMIAWCQRQRHESKWRALDGASDDDLQAIADEEGSLRIPLADLRDVAIRSRSIWLSLFCCAPPHAGVLRFTHPTRGPLTFVFPTSHDMLTAFESLRPLLGERLAVNVV
jgi:hypothetical protein